MVWMQVRRGLGPPRLAGTTGEPSAGRTRVRHPAIAVGHLGQRERVALRDRQRLADPHAEVAEVVRPPPGDAGQRLLDRRRVVGGRQRRRALRQQHDAQAIAGRQAIRDCRRRGAQGRFGAAKDARFVDRDVEGPAAAGRHRGLGRHHLARRPVDRDGERLRVEHRHRRAARRDDDVDADGGRRRPARRRRAGRRDDRARHDPRGEPAGRARHHGFAPVAR